MPLSWEEPGDAPLPLGATPSACPFYSMKPQSTCCEVRGAPTHLPEGPSEVLAVRQQEETLADICCLSWVMAMCVHYMRTHGRCISNECPWPGAVAHTCDSSYLGSIPKLNPQKCKKKEKGLLWARAGVHTYNLSTRETEARSAQV